MLARTTGRRATSALLAALIAVALVAVGGPTRSSADGVSADSGHAHVAAKYVRATQAAAPEHVDHARVHLDLATTPPVANDDSQETVTDSASTLADVHPSRDVVVATGRGPPTP